MVENNMHCNRNEKQRRQRRKNKNEVLTSVTFLIETPFSGNYRKPFQPAAGVKERATSCSSAQYHDRSGSYIFRVGDTNMCPRISPRRCITSLAQSRWTDVSYSGI